MDRENILVFSGCLLKVYTACCLHKIQSNDNRKLEIIAAKIRQRRCYRLVNRSKDLHNQ